MQTSNGMNNQKSQPYFLLILLTGVLILAFFIFRPFLYALILAAVFAVVFQPVYQKIVSVFRRQQAPLEAETLTGQGLAALATILIVVIFIFTPLIFLGIQIFQEAQQLFFSLTNTENGGRDAVFSILNGLMDSVKNYFPATQEFSINISEYIKQGLSWLLQHLGVLFGSIAKIALSSFIFFISLYYLLKDGHRLKEFLIAVSPLTDDADEAIFKKLGLAVNSVVKGNLTIALIQGALTAVGFALFGVPNAVLWGTVAAIAALIPGIGTALVLTPAVIFLFLTSGPFHGFGLLVWGIGAVGLIDNFLGPKLVGHGMQIHPLIVLLSVLGGLAFFGPIGFLLGPLTLSLLFALLSIYSSLAIAK